MTKLEKLKNQLKLAEKKAEGKKDDDSIGDWLWGYIDGLERAIAIMEEDNNGNN